MHRHPDQAFAQGWQDAYRLRRDVLAGGPLPELFSGNVRLLHGEAVHGDTVLAHDIWCAMEVTYTHTRPGIGPPLAMAVGFAVSAIGNAARRSRAEQMAMHQWRPLGLARTLVTNLRVLAHVDNRWLSWSHDEIMELWPSPGAFSFVILPHGHDPLRLSGPWAPWHCVVLAFLLYGPRYLAEHPEFQTMGQPPRLIEGRVESERARGT